MYTISDKDLFLFSNNLSFQTLTLKTIFLLFLVLFIYFFIYICIYLSCHHGKSAERTYIEPAMASLITTKLF